MMHYLLSSAAHTLQPPYAYNKHNPLRTTSWPAAPSRKSGSLDSPQNKKQEITLLSSKTSESLITLFTTSSTSRGVNLCVTHYSPYSTTLQEDGAAPSYSLSLLPPDLTHEIHIFLLTCWRSQFSLSVYLFDSRSVGRSVCVCNARKTCSRVSPTEENTHALSFLQKKLP
uniref:(northern house mosquito) hypothetical protein n=1 Tax=Culex pipiens TaxID=7175 RepID=A0A8D8B3B2_CULPI